MDLNIHDIELLESELAKDLEALKRVKAMIQRATGDQGPSIVDVNIRRIGGHQDQAPGVNTGLQDLVLQIVKAKPGIRSADVKNEAVERGYKFRTSANAASSTFSALKRLVKLGKVSKRAMKYYIIEQGDLLHSA
jgi:hypothetical protein